jgi:CO/xanthine dehydrogenase FAD-binding subunit
VAIVFHPLSLQEALRVRSREHAQVLAGGTDWMVRQARFSNQERPVLYISRLKELQEITLQGEELSIGAACTLTELLQSSLLPEYLKQPLVQMASPAIRNVATIGGNVCNASPAADALPMLYALDAVLCLQSEGNTEWVSVQDFVLGPGRTRLNEGQLLTQIRIPLRQGWHCFYHKAGMRRANSLSKLSFYALAEHASGRLKDVRIAFGAVAPTVVRSREAEEKIISGNRPLSSEQLQSILAQYDTLLKPIDDARSNASYRREISLRLLRQYLRERIYA